MREFLRNLRQRLCTHKWRVSKFQPLIPGTSYTCVKCGLHEQFYPRPEASSLASTEGAEG
jgi:hypothetical protein